MQWRFREGLPFADRWMQDQPSDASTSPDSDSNSSVDSGASGPYHSGTREGGVGTSPPSYEKALYM